MEEAYGVRAYSYVRACVCSCCVDRVRSAILLSTKGTAADGARVCTCMCVYASAV